MDEQPFLPDVLPWSVEKPFLAVRSREHATLVLGMVWYSGDYGSFRVKDKGISAKISHELRKKNSQWLGSDCKSFVNVRLT